MKTKLFEIRDRATFIPVFATQVMPESEVQRRLIRAVGYGLDVGPIMVLIGRLSGGGQCHSDPYEWADRTFTVAHDYIARNFDQLEDGDVVDVEYILGETNAPKRSDLT